MYLPICPYSRQKEYCLASELRTGSGSTSTSDLLYNCGENHLTSVLPTFSSWKIGVILNCKGMRGLSNQSLNDVWRTDAPKDATELHCSGGTFSKPCHALLCRASKWLSWIRREASPHARPRSSCKWRCRLQMMKGSHLFGFSEGLLSPSEGGLSFFLKTARKALLCSAFREAEFEWCDWNYQGSHSKRMVFLQTEKTLAGGGTSLWMLLNLFFYIPKASKTTNCFLSLTTLHCLEDAAETFWDGDRLGGRDSLISSECLSLFCLDVAFFWACLPSAVPGVHGMLSG